MKIETRHAIATTDAARLEKMLHSAFCNRRTAQEWFRLTEIELSCLKAMTALAFTDPEENAKTPMHRKGTSFPARLTALREKAKFSINELAAEAELSDDAIRHYEAGTRSPSWENVQKLARALGISTDTFRDK